MTQTQIRALRRGQHVMTPDGAVARITTDPYPRPGTVDMQVGASYLHHAFVLHHNNSQGWTLTGDPSDRFVYALPDLEGGPLSKMPEAERERDYLEGVAAWRRKPLIERMRITACLRERGVDVSALMSKPG